MKSNHTVIYGVLFIMVLMGCTTIPKPTPENDTLVVGRFQMVNNQRNSPKGTFSGGITLKFRCIEDDRTTSVTTQTDGWFFLSKVTSGIYELTQASYTRESGNTRYIFDPIIERCFVIEKGKVNNLGVINLYFEDRGSRLEESREYGSIKNDFSTKFAQSAWNSEEWANIKMRLGAQAIDNNHMVQDEIFLKNDPARFYWLWIVWNDIAGHQVKGYPVPTDSMTAAQWVRENIGLVTGTKLIHTSVRMYTTDKTEKEYSAIVDTGTQIINTYCLFNYKTPDTGEVYDSILIGW